MGERERIEKMTAREKRHEIVHQNKAELDKKMAKEREDRLKAEMIKQDRINRLTKKKNQRRNSKQSLAEQRRLALVQKKEAERRKRGEEAEKKSLEAAERRKEMEKQKILSLKMECEMRKLKQEEKAVKLARQKRAEEYKRTALLERMQKRSEKQNLLEKKKEEVVKERRVANDRIHDLKSQFNRELELLLQSDEFQSCPSKAAQKLQSIAAKYMKDPSMCDKKFAKLGIDTKAEK